MFAERMDLSQRPTFVISAVSFAMETLAKVMRSLFLV
jgi:hypothetical protein